MMLRYFRLTTIILLFLSFFMPPAWCGNELTREKAKELLTKQYLEPDSGILEYYNLFDKSRNVMVNNGLITLQGNKAILTSKGKQYLIKEGRFTIQPFVTLNGYMVKTAMVKFDEITGITMPRPNIAKVEYNCIIYDVTPFGQLLGAREGSINRIAIFTLYDDGWRLIDKDKEK